MVRVLATAGTDNQQTLKALGLDIAMDYTRDDVPEMALDYTAGMGVDADFDTVGGEIVVNSIPETRPYERIATILGDPKNQVLYGVLPTRERVRLDKTSRLIKRGQTKPQVDEVLALDEVRKAHQRLESGHGRGKSVLRVA